MPTLKENPPEPEPTDGPAPKLNENGLAAASAAGAAVVAAVPPKVNGAGVAVDEVACPAGAGAPN